MRRAVCAKSRLCELLRFAIGITGYNKWQFCHAMKHDFGMSQPNIAHYQLLSRLGQGAMGVVFRARDERLERDVAIKLLQVSLDNAEAADYAARLLQEARSAARLNHPGIITVFDCGEWRGKPYLAMELVQGISLKAVLEKRGTLAVRDVIRIAKQIFSALAHAHHHDVVHRDIKPANLMLTKDGRLKITDFGIAQLPASDLTRTGTILGSPRYMSPEQLAGSKLDGRADIYSAGVVLYQALTGKVPFDGETTMNIVFHILHSEPTNPRELNAAVPPWLVDLILRCLAKKREDRFASADEVLQAIQSAGIDTVASIKPTESAAVNEPEIEVAEQPAAAAVEQSPILSWLQQTAVTLTWVLQQTWFLLGKILRQLWPWLLRATAMIKKWVPIACAQLLRAWHLIQPVLKTAVVRAKQQFLALPKQLQLAIVGCGFASLAWLLWPNPDREIAAATITWSSPSTPSSSEQALPIVSHPMEPAQNEAKPIEPVLVTPEPARETFYEREEIRSQIELKPTPLPKVKQEQSGLSARFRQVGETVDSAVTDAMNCFSGKAPCPTPAPELQRRGGG